jgi:hypothetical protein
LGAAANTIMAPDRDWQNTLAYLREETAPDAVVMAHWNYGYWILDLAQRRPVVDNGYYHFDRQRNHDIGVALTTNDPAETAEMMIRHGADYLIFSKTDRFFAGVYIEEANLGSGFEGVMEFPPDSMIIRTLDGDFDSGGGLEVVYRSDPDGDVVVLQAVSIGQD